MNAAILCSRKGSKRLPAKAWLEIDGQYVWQFAARAMLEAVRQGHVQHALVSSDDKRLTEMAGEMGLYPVVRPQDLCSDTASIHHALVHALGEFERDAPLEAGKTQLIAFVPANVPTIKPELIRDCFAAMKLKPRATASMTVRPVQDHPQWMWRNERGVLRRLQEGSAYRQQDLPALFTATGTCQVVRRKVLMSCKSDAAFEWLGDEIAPVLDAEAIEIHTQRDYLLAKSVLEA